VRFTPVLCRRSALALCLSLPFAPFAATARAEIKIGFSAPLSGPLTAVGQQLRAGAEQAVRDINAKGGVLGQKLVLVVEDDGALPNQAVSVANKLTTQGVVAVIGHLQSSTTLPAAKIYGDEGIITITPTATAPEVTESANGLVFRTCGRDDQQGAAAVAYLAQTYVGKRIAVLHDQTTYGKGLADVTKKGLEAKGFTPVLYAAITPGERDYSATVTKLKAEQADLVYYGGYYSDAAQLLRQMRDGGLNAALMTGDTLATDDFWALAGPVAGEGALMTFSADARSIPAAKQAMANFRAAGYEPGSFPLYAYAAVELWAKGAEAAGSAIGEKVAKALRQRSYETAIGTLAYDAKGDRVQADYVVYRWSRGSYSRVEP
jgi:branched-chain amino acid transport system substrate-binding protein